jgi:hypothetical protein
MCGTVRLKARARSVAIMEARRPLLLPYGKARNGWEGWDERRFLFEHRRRCKTNKAIAPIRDGLLGGGLVSTARAVPLHNLTGADVGVDVGRGVPAAWQRGRCGRCRSTQRLAVSQCPSVPQRCHNPDLTTTTGAWLKCKVRGGRLPSAVHHTGGGELDLLMVHWAGFQGGAASTAFGVAPHARRHGR